MMEKDFWLSLQQDAHIEDVSYCSLFSLLSFSDTEIRKQRLEKEGYAPFLNNDWGSLIERCHRIVSRLYELQVPVVFSFLYDEFWELFAKMRPALLQAFGGEYNILPQFWTWYIDPQKGGAGWPPHRDCGRASLFPDGSPKSLSVWLALSHATPENGCMYVVPAHLDAKYNTEEENEFNGFRYTHIRALPAKPGDFFMWNQALLHWGSQSTSFATEPRLSTSMEFIKKGEPAFRKDLPFINPKKMISFSDRLYLCSELLLQYQHMHHDNGIFIDFARKMIALRK